jgi:hypothetical protein
MFISCASRLYDDDDDDDDDVLKESIKLDLKT